MCEEEQTLPETRPGPAPTRKSGPNSEERALYRALKPALQASMDRWQLPQSMLHLRGAKSFASVLVGSILLCRLYAGKRPGLEIQGTDAALVPAGLPEEAMHIGRDKTRLDLPAGADAGALLGPLMDALVQRAARQMPKTFDCCHLYNECSAAGRCVNPNAAQAVGCGYKRVLTAGKCYYGPGRNV